MASCDLIVPMETASSSAVTWGGLFQVSIVLQLAAGLPRGGLGRVQMPDLPLHPRPHLLTGPTTAYHVLSPQLLQLLFCIGCCLASCSLEGNVQGML